jgi:antitoxin VapB
MRDRAKLFRNGGSQAVRLPRSCRFPDDQDEVVVHREGRRVILEPLDEWPAAFQRCLGAWADEIERPAAPLAPALKDPFE